MKIALCQINPTVGAFEKNKELILKYYNECIQENADIIVFPELVITGYPPQDLLWEEGFVEQNLEIINHIASHSTVPVIVGFIRKGDGEIFNSAAVCYDGKLQATYDKILLPTYDVFDEDRYFSSGKEPAVISVPINGEEKILGIQICEDLWDRDYECKVSQIQKEKGAEILINISSSPYQKGRLINRREVIMEKVNET
ncbi:uncharacterized protein METZ01_LOCUS97650, partial [marine metagenome]